MQTLKQGDSVPDFSSKDEQGNIVTLKDYKGKKLVVFFYPKASTPGCTVEACNLRDHYKELQAQGYELLGVSADSEKRQANFKNKYEKTVNSTGIIVFCKANSIIAIQELHSNKREENFRSCNL